MHHTINKFYREKNCLQIFDKDLLICLLVSNCNPCLIRGMLKLQKEKLQGVGLFCFFVLKQAICLPIFLLINRLFSKKDVDYRQLLPRPALLPTPVGPAFNITDQDDRNPNSRDPGVRDPTARDPLAPINPSDNQDPNIARAKGELGPPGVGSPLMGPLDPRMRKPSFNSPHAASWEKFREKNPEFKEYQRQASTSGGILFSSLSL